MASQESNVCPRSRAITASNQNNVFHLFDPQPKLSGEGEPFVDMPYYPPLKLALRQSIFTLSMYWQG
jgi:hypothetical protein